MNDSNGARIEEIRARLERTLAPDHLQIIDESHLHVGHAGARDGRGHFRVRMVSDSLAALPRLAYHRRIYQALGDLMQTDIHALSIEVLSRNEA